MATGAGIRDFTKVYRELTYSNEGSIRLTGTEHNAYLNRLTLEVTHYDAYRSFNFKSNPDTTHWGYLTSFKGSSVVDKMAVNFVKQRVFEHINSGIWQYHSAQENLRLQKSFAESAANSILQSELLEDAQSKAVDFYLRLISSLPDQVEEDLRWILSFTYRGEGEEPQTNEDYTAFPICSPFPDVFKFKSDIPCAFKFRLETWYLVNPSVYIVANPTDASDETDDESEYPEPNPGNGNGQGQEFPPSSAPNPDSDPRDFEGGLEEGTGVWTFSISFGDGGGNPFCLQVPAATLALRGYPDEPPKKRFTGPRKMPEGGTPGEYYTSVDSAAFGGDCTVSDVVNPVFIADGPSQA